MAEITVPGPQSGRNYTFRIAGSSPSVDERLRIDSYISQAEQAFQQEYAQVMGRPMETDEGSGLLNWLGEFPKGVVSGAIGGLETGLLGAGALLPEGAEDAYREAVRSAAYAVKPQADIGMEDTVSGKFGQALGSFGAVLGAGMVGGPVGAGALAVGMGAGEASERARAAGATPEQRSQAALLGAPVGALELLPIKFMKTLGRDATLSITQRVQRALASGGVEGAQETAAQIAQNLIAQGVYDPDQGAFTDTGEAAGYGAGVGAFVQAVMDLAIPGRSRGSVPRLLPPPKAPTTAAPPPPAETFDADTQDVGLPDPALPIDTDTLDALGIPTASGTYKRIATRTLPDEVAVRQLESFAENAALSERADLRMLVPRVLQYVERFRAERQQPSLPFEPTETGAGRDDQRRDVGGIRGIVPRDEPALVRRGQPAAEPATPDTSGVGPSALPAGDVDGAEADRETAVTEPPLPVPTSQTPEEGTVPEDATPLAPSKQVRGREKRRPFTDMLKSYIPEGIDPNGTVGRELKARGVTAKTAPGLFKRGGRDDVDNLVASELGSYATVLPSDNGYFDRQSVIDAIEAEARGEPVRDAEQQEIADDIAAKAAADEYASRMAEVDARLATVVNVTDAERAAVKRLVDAGTDIDEAIYDVSVAADAGQDLDSLGRPETPPQRPLPEDMADFGPVMAFAQPEAAQPTLPGVEPVTDRERAEAQMEAPMRGAAAPADEGLFDVAGRAQQDMFDQPLPTVPKGPEYQPMSGAAPGITTGTARQIIPEPRVRPTPSPAVAPTPEAVAAPTPRTPIPAAEAEGAILEDRIAEWFTDNAPDELIAQSIRLAEDAESMPTTVEDKRAILSLLQRNPKRQRGRATSPEAAAFLYFSRHPDAGTALEAIAFDLAGTDSTVANVPQLRDKQHIRALEPVRTPQIEADIAYFDQTGVRNAQRAARWIKDNLSPETVARIQSAVSGRYRPRDFEAKSELRDRAKKIRESQSEETDVTRAIFDPNIDLEDTASEFGMAETDMSGFDDLMVDFRPMSPGGTQLHPRAVAYLRNGDIVSALRVFSVTTTDKQARLLAEKLMSRVQGTPTQVVPADTMTRIAALFAGGDPVLTDIAPAGVFIPPATPAQIEALRDVAPERAAVYEQYGGQILLNADGGLDGRTLLHEAAHAATDRVLTNQSHPLTRQLETLRRQLLEFMPKSTYGLRDVRELLAEGMTNPTFRRDLSLVNPNGAKHSAWDKFKNAIANFLRQMLGRKPRDLDSAKDTVDRVLDSILASRPSEIGAGEVLGASFRPNGARDVLGQLANRVQAPDRAGLDRLAQRLRDVRIPARWKSTMIWATMPLDYVVDAAQKYFPSARRVHDLVLEHAREQQVLTERVTTTMKSIASWVKTNADKVDDFNRVRFLATLHEVDPRKPRSAYTGYSYKYDVLDQSGDVVRTVESRRYKTSQERNRALQAHNRANMRQVSKAKVSFSEDAEQLDVWDRIAPMYRGLGQEGRAAMNRAFELPTNLSEDLASVLRDRLEALLPGQRSLQERIYGQIYNKVFAGKLIDPYQTLQRRGSYWLSYEAQDPDNPGQMELFKHSFASEQERNTAIRMLEQDGDVTNITPYQQAAGYARERVPTQFVAQVLSKIEASEGLDSSTRQQIVELVFDAAPETSFINAFRKRQNRRGFIGDVTPLTEGLTPGDTLTNLQSSALRIAKNIADLKYGAKFARARLDLDTELATLNSEPPTGDIVKAAADRAEAGAYHEALVGYTHAAFSTRSNWSRNLTSGTYALTLGFNASTALITMMQIPMFVAPFLSGRHGMRSTVQSLGIASRILAGSGRERTVDRVGETGQTEELRTKIGWYDFSLDNLDLTDPASEFSYLSELQDVARRNGVFNRSLVQDILQGEDAGGVSGAWQSLMAKTGIFQHHAERYSRETTLMAAYHLALKETAKRNNMGDYSVKQLTKKMQDGTLQFTSEQRTAAALDAVNTAEKTNGSLYAATAPLASQGDIGAIIYLFKRHPLSMYNLLAQTVKRSLPSNASIEDKRVARFQIAGMMGMIGLSAGALGLPLVQQIGWMYDLFADDDEEDFETVVRTTLGEFGSFGVVDYLTGLRISERVGLSGAFYRPGFNADNLPLLFQVIEGVGGPVVGLALKTDRAADLFSRGEIQRGVETVLPTSVANVMRGVRFATEGIETTRGDPIVSDIGPFGATAQFFGFMPAEYARQLDVNSAGARIDTAINRKRSALLRKRYIAYAQGDRDLLRDVEQEIAEFNRKHPYNPITAETKRRSLRGHIETTSKMHHGVQFSEKNMPRIMQVVNDFGPASIYE